VRIVFRFAQGKEGWDLAVTSAKKKVGMGQTIATILRDHIVYRKQIIKLAGSDLRRTYRASALGWAWAVIKPLVTIFVYWFAFSVGLRKGGDIAGYPFVLWLISGIVPWFYMSEMLTLGTECILRNRYLVTKMKYPVSTIPTFTSISKFFVHLILLVLTMLIFILTGHMPTVYMLQLPFYMLCNFLFFTGWALFAAPIAAISTDFSNLVKSFVTAVFWLSGILWEVDSMHDKLAHQLLMLNPVTFICNGYRNCFIYETWFFEQPKRLLYFAVALVLIYALGFWSYRRTRSEMADVL
jgi:teichoic acid transport system permease protein